MKKEADVRESLANLVEDAQALLAATTNVAEAKVVEARKRLAGALERGKETWGEIQDSAAAQAKAADELIRKHPYESIGVAFGVGALVGLLIGRRN
jgi:ElaB/YqjD/DUF883 family membrane-anchored ribosome-binding protein